MRSNVLRGIESDLAYKKKTRGFSPNTFYGLEALYHPLSSSILKDAEATYVEIATEMKKMLQTERHAQFQCSLKFLANHVLAALFRK